MPVASPAEGIAYGRLAIERTNLRGPMMHSLQPYLTDAQQYLVQALDFAHQGFLQVNVVLGLLIAVVAAFMLGQYRLRPTILRPRSARRWCSSSRKSWCR